MKAIKLLIIISILLPGTSCVTRKACERKFPTETMIIRKDSIIRETTTIFRDTTVYITVPGENQYFTDTVYVKDGMIYFKPSHLRTSFAESDAWIENNRIMHTLTQNDTIVPITIKNAIRLTWERAEKYFSKDQTRIVEKKVIPKWVKLLAFVGAATLIYVLYRITRLFKM